MVFDEMGQEDGMTLMLLPGTCCNYETNFGLVLEELGNHYHLICVNYDGFDGSDKVFPDIREFHMQHEQWLFGDNDWTKPVLETVYECMDMPV